MSEVDEFLMDYVDTDTTCAICYAEFLDLEDLELHKRQVHAASKVPCQFCTAKFGDIEEYARHIRDDHIADLVSCQYCTRVFLDKNDHRRHESRHRTSSSKASYSCSQCKTLFNTLVDLEKHEYNIHKDSDDGVLLQDCLSHLSSLLNINALKFVQSIGTNMIYYCVKCHSTSSSPVDYINHLKVSNCSSYACDACSFVYKNKQGLQKHYAAHKECYYYMNKNCTKKCSECLKDFPVRIWKEHQKHCKPIKCKTCEIIFETMDGLSKHQMERHPLVVSLQTCKYCKREFVGTVALDKHMERSHKDHLHLYKYICVYCDAVFKHPKKLFGHFYTKHKDIEPYTCKICDKKFKLRKRFTLHIKLDHQSTGFVEFDGDFHVYFTDKKPEKPIQQQEQAPIENMENKKVSFKEPDDHIAPSDFMDLTETEGNQTELEAKIPDRPKRKLRLKTNESSRKKLKKALRETEETRGTSSDDEPLLEVRKRVQNKMKGRLKYATLNRRKTLLIKPNIKRFRCEYCKKQCYTYQKYHHHLNTQHQNETAKCIKCSRSFKSKQKLSDHIARVHSTSKLTETLKSLLEKRKSNSRPVSELSNAEKFERTIKKVECDTAAVPAKLMPFTKGGLSVQKFIENFTPENEPVKQINTDSNISIKTVKGVVKAPVIKLTKFEDKLGMERYFGSKLAMPVKFKPDGEEHTCHIKLVQNAPPKPTFIEEENYQNDTEVTQEYYEEIQEHAADDKDCIPEVAQEVMLEETEETPRVIQVPHKIVIPKLPKELKQMRIAHLMPEAPFYKIVKINDVLKSNVIEEPKEIKEEKDIKLPDGTKLVNVNPLAHLLKDVPVEKILENFKPNKYYKSKSKDFEKAVAKALLNNIENPNSKRKAKKNPVKMVQ